MVCFIGPQRGTKWVPVVANCSTLKISLCDWYNLNPLARHLSAGTGASIYLWCYDSGYVAGYSLFLQGELEEAQTVFSRSVMGEDTKLMPGVPIPDDHQGQTSLATVLNNPEFDYRQFMKHYDDLEDATAAFVVSFGVVEHLCDFDLLARGMGGVAVIEGKYQPISLSDEWVVIIYENLTPSY